MRRRRIKESVARETVRLEPIDEEVDIVARLCELPRIEVPYAHPGAGARPIHRRRSVHRTRVYEVHDAPVPSRDTEGWSNYWSHIESVTEDQRPYLSIGG